MMPMALFYKWFGSSPTGHRRSFLRAADLPPMLRDVPPAAALCRVFAMAQASSHSRTTNWFAHAGCSLILAGCRLQHRSHSLWNDVPGHSGFLHSLLHVEVHRCRAHLRHSSRWAWRCWTHGWQMTCWCEALRNQLWKALLICECSRVRGLAWQYVPQFPIAISSRRFSQARSRGICLLLLWCHVPWQSIRWSNRSENSWALKLQNRCEDLRISAGDFKGLYTLTEASCALCNALNILEWHVLLFSHMQCLKCAMWPLVTANQVQGFCILFVVQRRRQSSFPRWWWWWGGWH